MFPIRLFSLKSSNFVFIYFAHPSKARFSSWKKRICFFYKANHWRYLKIFYFNINFQKRSSYFCKSFDNFFFWLAISGCRLIHTCFSILLAKKSLKNLPTHSHVYKIFDVAKKRESISFKSTSIVFSDDLCHVFCIENHTFLVFFDIPIPAFFSLMP